MSNMGETGEILLGKIARSYCATTIKAFLATDFEI